MVTKEEQELKEALIPIDDSLLSSFQLQQKHEVAEVLKELFDEKKIYLIGDMTKDEIKLATRIYVIADMKNIEAWKKGLAFYVKCLLSRDRKSRKEIIEAIKGYTSPTSLWSKINPFNRARRI